MIKKKKDSTRYTRELVDAFSVARALRKNPRRLETVAKELGFSWKKVYRIAIALEKSGLKVKRTRSGRFIQWHITGNPFK